MARFQKGQSGNPAGRTRKADQNAGAVTRAEKQIRDHLPAIVEAQIILALGVVVEETDKETGATTVYKKAPDRAAGQYLIDRIMGKPTERQELTGPDGAPIAVEFTKALNTAYGDTSTTNE